MNYCEDYNGILYESESEMCRAHGVNFGTYQARRDKGLPIKACLTPYQNPFKEGNAFIYKNKEYKSLKACCDDLGILYHSVYQQINRNGLTPTAAIDKIICNNERRKSKAVA